MDIHANRNMMQANDPIPFTAFAHFKHSPKRSHCRGRLVSSPTILIHPFNNPHTLPTARAKAQVESHAQDAYISAAKDPYQIQPPVEIS